MIPKVTRFRYRSAQRSLNQIVNVNLRHIRSLSQDNNRKRTRKTPNENPLENMKTENSKWIDTDIIRNNRNKILSSAIIIFGTLYIYKFYNANVSDQNISGNSNDLKKIDEFSTISTDSDQKDDKFEILLKHLSSEDPIQKILSSRFKPVTKVDTKFKDIKGCDEVMQEMKNLVSFLKNPDDFKKMGATLPKGVLMVGEPGVGKTSIARAVAGEAGVPFIYANASEIDDMYVGVGASRIRELFQSARAFSPCVVFIDEIDIIGTKRVYNPSRSNTAFQTLSQLMVEMDGYNQTEGILVLGATNNKDSIDKALLRPGRFDLELVVQPPNFEGRKALFNLYLNKVRSDSVMNYGELASGTVSFTGAKIKNMVNQATIMATLAGDQHVTMTHLWAARDQIIMGHKQKPLDDKDTNRVTAIHEAGHALTAYFTPASVPVHQITIVPRNDSLGHTSYLEEKERHGITKQELQARIDSLMGGRIAEELILGKENVTTGAMSDLHRANEIAKDMVTKYGMSDNLPHQYFENNDENQRSQNTKLLLDKEIENILRASKERVELLLKSHKGDLLRLASCLEDKNTLSKKDMELLLLNNNKNVGHHHSKP